MSAAERLQANWQALRISRRLIEVGIALSAESNVERLLSLILTYAQELTHCDAGSLYLLEPAGLRIFISQNDAVKNFLLPLDHSSIAGYVVSQGVSLNIPDVYQLAGDLPYRFNRSVDEQTGYRTCSLLTVPMRDRQGQVIGALQLLNRLSWTDPPVCEPFSEFDQDVAESLASQAGVAYHNAKLQEQLKAAHYETIFRLSVAAEYRDHDTSYHLKRMSHYSRIIAKHLGLSEREQELILYASPMHDVGKLGIPDAILLKPGPLTVEERACMQRHPIIGAEILGKSDSELLQLSAVIALCHHEKYDGSGYPQGLKGEEIPLPGRIVALADVFDALASKRAYKKSWDLTQILEFIDQNTGSHFDPKVVAAFKAGFAEVMEVYERYQEPEAAGDN
ncbi:MAG: HD domain-containing protein [Thermostichales cyanobacterium DRC_bins_46]